MVDNNGKFLRFDGRSFGKSSLVFFDHIVGFKHSVMDFILIFFKKSFVDLVVSNMFVGGGYLNIFLIIIIIGETIVGKINLHNSDSEFSMTCGFIKVTNIQ